MRDMSYELMSSIIQAIGAGVTAVVAVLGYRLAVQRFGIESERDKQREKAKLREILGPQQRSHYSDVHGVARVVGLLRDQGYRFGDVIEVYKGLFLLDWKNGDGGWNWHLAMVLYNLRDERPDLLSEEEREQAFERHCFNLDRMTRKPSMAEAIEATPGNVIYPSTAL